MAKEDQVAGLLASQLGSALQHGLQDVPVPHLGLDHPDPGLLHAPPETEVRHDRGDHGVAGEVAALLHAQGTCREDLTKPRPVLHQLRLAGQ